MPFFAQKLFFEAAVPPNRPQKLGQHPQTINIQGSTGDFWNLVFLQNDGISCVEFLPIKRKNYERKAATILKNKNKNEHNKHPLHGTPDINQLAILGETGGNWATIFWRYLGIFVLLNFAEIHLPMKNIMYTIGPIIALQHHFL